MDVVKADLARILDTQRKERLFADMIASAKRVSIAPFSLDPNLRFILPSRLARAYSIIPIAVCDGLPTLAVSVPVNIEYLDELYRFLRTGFAIAIANREDILLAIDEMYW